MENNEIHIKEVMGISEVVLKLPIEGCSPLSVEVSNVNGILYISIIDEYNNLMCPTPSIENDII